MSYTLNELNVLTIIEENGYYPYGLKHENYNTVLNRYKAVLNETKVALKEAPGGGQVALNDNINDYKFNGQEWQEELGLDVTAMDFRQYSNDIGRFVCVDPVTHFSQTPYQFGNGNPMYWADPSGLDGISPEPINTWHYAGGNQMNTGAGNLSNGDHMFGASGDAFWGGQGAFTGGDLAWNNYNAANGIQNFYGAEAIKVFSYLAMANGHTRAVFIERDPLAISSGGIGGGFFDYIKGSVGVDGLKIFGDGGDAVAGSGVMKNDRGSGSIDVSNSFGGGRVGDAWNLGSVLGSFFNWFTTNRTITPAQTVSRPQPFSVTVPATVEMQRYDWTASDAVGSSGSVPYAGTPRDTSVVNGNESSVNKLNTRDSLRAAEISNYKNAVHKRKFGY